MQHAVQPPIEGRAERAVVQHRQIVGILPVALAAQLVLNGGEEARAGQRVRHRHADVIRPTVAHHLECALNVLAGFAGVTKLQKEAHLDVGRVQPAGSLVDVLDVCAFFHRVEDPLRA